jgi:hypothetical protein
MMRGVCSSGVPRRIRDTRIKITTHCTASITNKRLKSIHISIDHRIRKIGVLGASPAMATRDIAILQYRIQLLHLIEGGAARVV